MKSIHDEEVKQDVLKLQEETIKKYEGVKGKKVTKGNLDK